MGEKIAEKREENVPPVDYPKMEQPLEKDEEIKGQEAPKK